MSGSCGSSPRTRGTQSPAAMRSAKIRFIPAHAGNIAEHIPGRSLDPVHPRARGEHLDPSAAVVRPRGSSPRTRGTRPHLIQSGNISGSSPRTRGTLPFEHRGTHKRRFIPAHAGNTGLPSTAQLSSPVHPRARGEHMISNTRPCPLPGSSPRTRGTRRGSPERTVATSVHPRARGEHVT